MALISLQSFLWTVQGANIHTFWSYTQGCKGEIDTNTSGCTVRIANLGRLKKKGVPAITCMVSRVGSYEYFAVKELVPPWIKPSSNTWMNFYLAYLSRYASVTMHFSLNTESDLSCWIQAPMQKKLGVSARCSKEYVFVGIGNRPTMP